MNDDIVADLYEGDCLEVMNNIADSSVDLILADPPFGTTQCKWDSIIPLEPMWQQLKRIIKPNGAIVLNSAQPFTTALIASNYDMFKYCWVWDKVDKYTNHLNAKHQPMRRYEDVAVFSKGKSIYYPIKREGSYLSRQTKVPKNNVYGDAAGKAEGEHINGLAPCNVLIQIKAHKQTTGSIPTEKPVKLMEYMIRTYSQEGETVMDFCQGSGTTGVAALNLNRKYIGIEKDAETMVVARKRIREAQEK